MIADSLCWQSAPRDAEESAWADRLIDSEARGLLWRNPLFMRDNLLLDDEALAIKEAARFKAAGGGTIVETSSIGLGRDAAALQRIAMATDLHVVAGCGFYVEIAHPGWVADASVEQLRDHMLRDILEGIDGSTIRAGIIGELGTSYAVTPVEERVLQAGAMAQRQTGLAVTIHMGGRAGEAERVLTILEQAGADLTRVILGHMDDDLADVEAHRAAARRGAFLEYDAFGAEWYFDGLDAVTARDTDRIQMLDRMASWGHLDQVLIAQDIWLKQGWRRYGGLGYDHILRSIVPALLKTGFKQRDVQQLMIHNPARVLSGEQSPLER